MERYATFALDSLRKTRARENVPSQEEIRAIIARQEMSTTVHCHGGGSCKITINSHTTAGEVSRDQSASRRLETDPSGVEEKDSLLTADWFLGSWTAPLGICETI